MADEICAYTLKQELKQQLKENNPEHRYYKSIFNLTSDLIAMSDGDRIVDANQAFSTFFENIGEDIFSPEFLFARHFEVIDKYGYVYDGYQNRRWFETILLEEQKSHRVGIATEDEIRTFHISLKLLDPFDKFYVVTLNDITEMMGYKTVLEEGIKNSIKDREYSQFMLNQYDKAVKDSTLVYKCDLKGIITHVNQALSDALLYTSEELTGQHISILESQNINDDSYRSIWKQVKKGETYHGILENRDKGGNLHYFDVSIVPIFDPEGKIVEFLSIRHEITEVMRAKEIAVKTLESKTKFFDQVSHELRTPLNAIVNFTDQALESFDEIFEDDESRDLVHLYIERSHKNSKHLLELINSLLDMAKLRSGKELYAIHPIEIIPLVNDIFETTQSLNIKADVEYMIDVEDSVITILGDTLKLRQVIINLISNAIKFTEWGYVQLRVKSEGKECLIQIEDTGRGIPTEKIASIFEPFEQVGYGDEGTGLGLGIVHEYVKGMGMKLEVVSKSGEGSCFTLRIPMIKTDKEGE